MSHLLLLTKSTQSSVEVLPALALLPHHVKILPAEASALLDAPPCDAVLVDGRHDLAQVRSLTRVIRTTGIECPLILILTEGGLAVAASDWGMDDVILTTAGPAELEARLRLGIGRIAGDRTTATTRATSSPRAASWSTTRPTPPSSRTARSTSRSRSSSSSSSSRSTPAGSSPASSCCRRCGATTTSAARARSTSTYAGCAPSSAPSNETLIGTVRNVGYRFVATKTEPARDTADA